MKIGDKVRFLNEIGGGVVTGFQDKGIVLVQDADGFDIPVRISECVIVEEQGSPAAAPPKREAPRPQPAKTAETRSKEEPQPQRPFLSAERTGGDALNVCLCFVPVAIEALSQTEFEVYLVNDSNYCLDYLYLSGEGSNWMVRQHGTAEPNTKVYVETVGREVLNDLQHVCLQLTAYKEERTFRLKPALSVELRPDLTKFYKLHTFAPNDFFNERVLTWHFVRNDRPEHQVFANAGDLREALMGSHDKEDDTARPHIHAIAKKPSRQDEPEVIDLHAAELLDTTRGMTPADILEYQLDVFRKKMEEHRNHKGKKLIFIHGKGQGTLRNAVLRELQLKYKSCTSQDASFREYGFGATMVIIH